MTGSDGPDRVLLVEDQEDAADLLRILLTRRGYDVTVASSVGAATAAASAARFDVLVSDISLPDGDGFDLLELLRASGPLPAIALSGTDRSDLSNEKRVQQFDEHLRKPASVDQIVDALKRVRGRALSPHQRREAHPQRRKTHILLVDDDEIHVANVRRALDKGKIPDDLFSAEDGLAGLEVLRGGDFPRERRLVLLDLNMPRMNGIEFLRELRAAPELCATAVVVFTTSGERHDRAEAYSFSVAGYLVKPIGIAALIALMTTITDYWAQMEMP